jgi:membrane-associated phospholipid phosphatase
MDRRLPGDEDGLAPNRHVDRGPLGLAIVTLIPFLLMAAWARLVPVGGWEVDLARELAVGQRPWDDLLRLLSGTADLWIWTLLMTVLVVGLLAVRRWMAAMLVGLTVFGDAVGFLFKLLVGRSRPEDAVVAHLLGESFAFPSGHVVRFTALSAVIFWLICPPSWRLPAAVAGGLVGGLLMGYSRVALGVHWPSDALGGILLGLAWFGLMAGLVARLAANQAATRTDAPG